MADAIDDFLTGKTTGGDAATAPPATASQDATDAYLTGADIKTQTKAEPGPYSVERSWLQIPEIHNFAAGVTQGARDVVSSGLNLGAYVDKRVPFLAWLDRNNPLIGDPDAAAARMDAARKAYEASPEAQGYAGPAGRFVGQIGTTAPLVGPVAEGAGAGVNALAALAPKVPAIIPWAVRTATEGATAGGTFGGLISGGSDQPVGQSVQQGAEVGAVLGPAGSAVAKGAGLVSKGAVGTFDYLTGRGVGKDIEATMDAARQRAVASAPIPTATTPEVPSATAAQPAPQVVTAPQAGGAEATSQASLDANALTRRQDIAGKVDYLDQTLKDQPNVGRADFNEYVKGNLPTQAEGLGDARLAAVQRQVEPGSQAYTNMRDQAIKNRVDHFDNQAGTAPMLDTKETELADWDKKTLAPVWANKQPVNASNVLSDVDARLASPEAQIGPVEQALNEVRSRLFKRGTDQLQDDPQMLYGARRQISFMLSKAGRQANPAYGSDDVMRELIGVRDQLDNAIEPGAPGFGAWRAGHEAQMGDINRMDVLQGIRQNILGQNGDIQLSRLTTALKGLRTKMDQSGANPVHSLNLDDLEMLRNLRQDLLREGNKSLAMPVGSPTAANLDVGAQTGLNAATAGAHYVASHIPGGNLLVDTALTKRALANSAKAKALWERNLLAPPPTSQP